MFQDGRIIKTVPLNGGEPKELCRDLAKYYNLKWTVDGLNIIAYEPGWEQGKISEIWKIPVQGGTPVKLDISVPNLLYFALHPDNSRFVYSVTGETNSELWVMENFLPK